MEIKLPVRPAGVAMRDARTGSWPGNFTLTFPERSSPGSRMLEFRLAPSVAGTVFGALDYLTSFPYGCTEQTMSSFLPGIIVAQAMKEFGIPAKTDVQAKITAGLDRLYDFQHEDGGWGWWKTDDSGLFMTAYVVSGLAQAKAAGQLVAMDRLKRGTDWLRVQNAKEPHLNGDLRAYVLYALALAGQPQSADRLYVDRSQLGAYGLALLGLALGSDARAGEIAGLLEAKVKQDDAQAWWPSNRDELLDIGMDATPETTAYAMKLLTKLRPQSGVLPKAAIWLMNHRSEGYYWYSTKQTAMVVYGLSDYLKATGELKPNLTATIFVNDKAVLAKTIAGDDALSPEESVLRVPADQLSNRIRIEMDGKGRAFWSAAAEYSSLEPKLAKTGRVALNLLRDYFRLTPARDGEKIVYDLQPLNGLVSPGDTIAVRLTVSGGDWRYLLIEDPIPAGAEFVEHDNQYEVRGRPDWWTYWFTRRELHDDRMAIFQSWFPEGQKQYFYLLKVVNPGLFRVNPARVQPMYQPNYLSTTEGSQWEVK